MLRLGGLFGLLLMFGAVGCGDAGTAEADVQHLQTDEAKTKAEDAAAMYRQGAGKGNPHAEGTDGATPPEKGATP